MKKSLFVAASLIVAIAAGSAHAQNLDAIKARKDLLKEFGAVTKPVGGMMKGEVAFDLAVAQKALATYVTNAEKLKTLFPDDSKTGGDTEVLPVAFEKKADFLAGFAKLGEAAAAAKTTVKDEASMKAAFGAILKGNCTACHDTYRVKK
ncbi:MAG: cytochrome c [Hyphomicrobiaceae bacterium]|nr:cytochrome c [Hyphomicrobiaceae bacterium]